MYLRVCVRARARTCEYLILFFLYVVLVTVQRSFFLSRASSGPGLSHVSPPRFYPSTVSRVAIFTMEVLSFLVLCPYQPRRASRIFLTSHSHLLSSFLMLPRHVTLTDHIYASGSATGSIQLAGSRWLSLSTQWVRQHGNTFFGRNICFHVKNHIPFSRTS